MKLQSMTDFVLSQKGDNVKYAKFLKKPLELGMFVPCDEKGNVLMRPEKVSLYEHTIGDYENDLKYSEAKERVLFEGVKVIRNKENFFIIEPQVGSVYYRIKKKNTEVVVEDLFKFMTDITLTETAKKQIGI